MTILNEFKLNRNFGLDLLRSFSIWLVLLQHAGINLSGLQPLKIGGIGVEIFFVLSGYLIGNIIFNDLKKGNSLIPTLKQFWFRRWLRILPLYYIVLFLKFIFLDNSIGWNIFYYIFFLQNNFFGISFLEVSWSLVIEEWFYLFSPIFLFLSKKFLKTTFKILVAILCFILLINALRLFYVIIGNVPYQGVNSNPPFRFDSLFLGVLLAFLKENYVDFFNKMTRPFVFAVGLIMMTFYLFIFWNLSTPINMINSIIWIKTLGFFILPFSIFLIIPFISLITKPSNKIIFNFITHTSILTYAIYLIHPFIFSEILKEKTFSKIFIAITSTYLLAYLVYNFIEKPFLKFRDNKTQL